MPSLLQSFRRRLSSRNVGGGRRNYPLGGQEQVRLQNHASTKTSGGSNKSTPSLSSPVSVACLLNDDSSSIRNEEDAVFIDGNDSPSSLTDEGAQQETAYFSTSNEAPSSPPPPSWTPLYDQHHQADDSEVVASPTPRQATFFSTKSSKNHSTTTAQSKEAATPFESCRGDGLLMMHNDDDDELRVLMSQQQDDASPVASISRDEAVIELGEPTDYLGAQETIPSQAEGDEEAKNVQDIDSPVAAKDESSFCKSSSFLRECLSSVPDTVVRQQQQQHQSLEDDNVTSQPSAPGDNLSIIIRQPSASSMPESPNTLPADDIMSISPCPRNMLLHPVTELCLLDHDSPSTISQLTTTTFDHATTSTATSTTTNYHTAKDQISSMSSKSTVVLPRPTQKQQAPKTVIAAPTVAPRKSDANANDFVGKRVEIIAGVNKKYQFGVIQQWKNEILLEVRVNTSATSSSAEGTDEATTKIVNVRNTSIRVLLQPEASTPTALENVSAVDDEDEQMHDTASRSSSSTKDGDDDDDSIKMADLSVPPKVIQKTKESDVVAAVQRESQTLKNHVSSVPDDDDDTVQVASSRASTNVVLRPTPKRVDKSPDDSNLSVHSVLRPTPNLFQEDRQNRPISNNTIQAASTAASANISTMNFIWRPTPKRVAEAFVNNQTKSDNNVRAGASSNSAAVNSVLRPARDIFQTESNSKVQTDAASAGLSNVTSVLRRTPTGRLVLQDDNQQPESSNQLISSSGKNGILFKRVKITKGDKKHKGKFGKIICDNDKRSIKVKLDDSGLVVGKALSSLEVIAKTTLSQEDASADSQRKNETSTDEDDKAAKKKLNASPRISLRRRTTAAASNIMPGRRLSLNRSTATKISMPMASSSTPASNDTGMAWRVTGYNRGGMKFGQLRVAKLRLQDDSAKNEITFLSHLLGDRILVVDVPLNGRKSQKPLDKTIVRDGCKYELVSAKEHDDSDQGGGTFGKPKLVRLMYAQVEGDGMSSFSIEDMLLNIGNFSVLNPRKIMARLELFQSPARFNIVFLPPHHFQSIKDKGYVGCGFISDDMAIRVCTQGGMSKTHAARVVALQVRLFIPTMGIYKGMLMRSPLAGKNGQDDIQLPASMLKVVRSTNSEALQDAAILVCKNGVHPSPGSANEYIGRRLNIDLKDPPEKSFKEKIKKPLSDMVFRLWRTLGVPDKVCKMYKKESLKTSGRNHAWLVGVADPTNSLSPDHVFITGTQSLAHVDKFFVTRSPCVKAEDGRMLPTVSSRPESMSVEHWAWLNALDFGCIIFSNPRPGQLSIPERIAKGDLDGDLYLVCWDEQVLAYMQAEPLVDEPSEDNFDAAPVVGQEDPDWFRNAQNIMIDASLVNDMSQLTGKCYKLAEAIADASDNKHLMLRHPDSIAFMQAYTDALEFKKHGGKIMLPLHLHDKVKPVHLQQYLTATPPSPTTL